VTFYRIARAKFDRPAIAFSGEAASKIAHRWNHPSPDIRAVYCSDSLALACLECVVHIRPFPRNLPPSVFYTVDVPQEMLEVAGRADLPGGWDSEVAGSESRDFGTAFLREGRAVGLVVPTVIQPLGTNLILNPLHPSFSLAWVHGPVPYAFDRRLGWFVK
jgi:RES domain-containing protein